MCGICVCDVGVLCMGLRVCDVGMFCMGLCVYTVSVCDVSVCVWVCLCVMSVYVMSVWCVGVYVCV